MSRLFWCLIVGLSLTFALSSRRSAAEGEAVCPTPPPRAAAKRAGAAVPVRTSSVCFAPPPPERTCVHSKPLCDADLQVAKIAWKYFQNNYQPTTGMTNAANNYPSTTMWDLGSSLFATLAAREFELISRKEFDDRINLLIGSLLTQKLYGDHEAPNKAYNTKTNEMTDYGNKVTTGIGYSALDIARISSALNALGCLHPYFAHGAKMVLERWKYCRMIRGGQMQGTFINPATKKEGLVQEGRLGYEQYAGKIFQGMGFDQRIAAKYHNEHFTSVLIYDVPIAVDVRDPRVAGANNFVVTESYVLDAMENGWDSENQPLVNNIYEVQKRRWKHTGIVTAVSEDNVNKTPYFIYNTIYAAGTPWACVMKGKSYEELRSVSTKAAFALITLFPNDPYSKVLSSQIASAYDPEKGWYSGVYESGAGYNSVTTANTNGIILEALLYKAVGPLNAICARCKLEVPFEAPKCCENCGGR